VTKKHIRSPKEAQLDFFVGDWHNSGRVMPGPFGPGGAITGSTSYQWAVGNKWLQFTSLLDLPGMGQYEVHGGVAFNVQSGKYDAYAANNLGNLMVYEGEWTDEHTLVFVHTHPTPAGKARLIYRKQPDGSIQMQSDQRDESGDFKTYFETNLMKAVPSHA
jgi:hypothetical protein